MGFEANPLPAVAWQSCRAADRLSEFDGRLQQRASSTKVGSSTAPNASKLEMLVKLRSSVSFALALVAATSAVASAKPTDAATCDITLRDLHIRRTPGSGSTVLTATYTNTACGSLEHEAPLVRLYAAGRFVRDIALPHVGVGHSAHFSASLPANIALNRLSFAAIESRAPSTSTRSMMSVSVLPIGLASPGTMGVSQGFCIRPKPNSIVLFFRKPLHGGQVRTR